MDAPCIYQFIFNIVYYWIVYATGLKGEIIQIKIDCSNDQR